MPKKYFRLVDKFINLAEDFARPKKNPRPQFHIVNDLQDLMDRIAKIRENGKLHREDQFYREGEFEEGCQKYQDMIIVKMLALTYFLLTPQRQELFDEFQLDIDRLRKFTHACRNTNIVAQEKLQQAEALLPDLQQMYIQYQELIPNLAFKAIDNLRNVVDKDLLPQSCDRKHLCELERDAIEIQEWLQEPQHIVSYAKLRDWESEIQFFENEYKSLRGVVVNPTPIRQLSQPSFLTERSGYMDQLRKSALHALQETTQMPLGWHSTELKKKTDIHIVSDDDTTPKLSPTRPKSSPTKK